jgi:hypothetical protein
MDFFSETVCCTQTIKPWRQRDTVCFQTLLVKNFTTIGDRIGDLIATYFPTLIKPDKVFFPKAIEVIPSEYHNDENFKWLKDFKENGYRKLNQIRKLTVHYTTEDTQFKYRHLSSSGERQKMERVV